MKKLLTKHIGLILCVLLSSLFIWGAVSWYQWVIEDYGYFAAGFFSYPLVALIVFPGLGVIWLLTTIIDDIINKPYG